MSASRLVSGLYEQAERIKEELSKESSVNTATYQSLAEAIHHISTAACELHSLESCVAGVSVQQTVQEKLEEIHEAQEAKEALNKIQKHIETAAKQKAEEAKAEEAKAEEAKAEEPYVTPEDTEQFEAPAETEDKTYTLEDLRSAVKSALAAGKLAEPRAFFEKFGCARASEVPPERYAEFMEALNSL